MMRTDNIENAMLLGAPRKWCDGRCSHCGTEFETSTRPQRDEDGVYIQQHRTLECAGCRKDLCEHCCEEGRAMRCECCGKLHCLECLEMIEDLPVCRACAPAFRLELEAEKRAAA